MAATLAVLLCTAAALLAPRTVPPPRSWRHRPAIACAPQPSPHEETAPDTLDDIAPADSLPTDLGPLPPVGNTLEQLDPANVGVVSLDLDSPIAVPRVDPSSTFVSLFLGCTPYIKMHQDTTMVIHVASEVLEHGSLFDLLMEEIAVLALLGVRPVLLVGVRKQIDSGLSRNQLPLVSHNGVRETNEETMRVVQEVCGYMRSRVEGSLSRGRSKLGPGGAVGVDVVGGNFFYTAQPVGVRDGVDYGYTGEVRSIDVAKVKQHLGAGEIVLLTALGYSASGAVFNVKTEQLAAAAAVALDAAKLIYVTPERLVTSASSGMRVPSTDCFTSEPAEECEAAGEHRGPFVCWAPPSGEVAVAEAWPVLQSMRLAEAKSVIDHYSKLSPNALRERPGDTPPPQPNPGPASPEGEVCDAAAPNEGRPAAGAGGGAGGAGGAGGRRSNGVARVAAAAGGGARGANGEAALEDDAYAQLCTARCLQLCVHSCKALELGVPRAHILPPAPGALIQELYTTDGIGTLMSRDVYDGIRLASAADIPSIIALIQPLEARGVLIKRPPEVLARDVDNGYYYVYTRDDTLLACAQLKRYSASHAELACLVVAPKYRRQGCGDAMLGFIERTAIAAGVANLFALSTHTMQWFMERGFGQVPVEALPARRIAIYNPKRASKIYLKQLSSSRLLDAEELFWDVRETKAEDARK